MTTAPARPTPNNMPSKPAFDPLRPARRDELTQPFRPLYERAMTQSGLHPHTRLVGLALATYADWDTGNIPAASQPRLAGLTNASGLHQPQVVVALNTLRSRGWIKQDGAVKWERSNVQLVIPRALLKRLQGQ
ncbi:hypothetical protein [Streptomyces marianii]|uniref:Helix-turn-helix domain-containing protein n=1 Tax=Streptomyces marianii TaxID=1817406 RepID=A0A5R9E701_9ACTN|nr:hypothetical protein [Streptomyces marianii]TLQ45788.1 hypothetical protein FEF34_24820 [Streptomyces marianii]